MFPGQILNDSKEAHDVKFYDIRSYDLVHLKKMNFKDTAIKLPLSDGRLYFSIRGKSVLLWLDPLPHNPDF